VRNYHLDVRGNQAQAVRQGSALVAVFWVLTILAIIITASSRLVKYDSDIVLHQVHGFRAKQLAETGANLASHPNVENGDVIVVEKTGRAESGEEEGYQFTIKSEDVRFNINRLVQNMETGSDLFLKELLVEEWGVNTDLVDKTIGALRDWIDRDDDENLNGAERGYYEAVGRNNQPYNRVFYSLDELTLVRGWNDVIAEVPGWKDWFTVLSPSGLNINYAESFLVAAASGANEVTVDEVVRQQVIGVDGELYTQDDVPFEDLELLLSELGVDPSREDYQQISSRFTQGESTVKRIESIGWSGKFGYKLTLVVQEESGLPTVLDKKEEIIPWQPKEN